MEGFTRQEAIALTNVTGGNLSYYDSSGFIVPQKHGNPRKSCVIYSPEQVLELAIIAELRERLSLQRIKLVIVVMRSRNHDQSLLNCPIAIIGDELIVISDWQEFGDKVLEVARANGGKVMVQEVGRIGDVLSQLAGKAKIGGVLAYDRRIECTVLRLREECQN